MHGKKSARFWQKTVIWTVFLIFISCFMSDTLFYGSDETWTTDQNHENTLWNDAMDGAEITEDNDETSEDATIDTPVSPVPLPMPVPDGFLPEAPSELPPSASPGINTEENNDEGEEQEKENQEETNEDNEENNPGIEAPPEEDIPEAEEDTEEKELPEEDFTIDQRQGSLGDWTDYNGLVFNRASIYDSFSGGGLAVAGALAIFTDHAVGATYTSRYDPTEHIGEYTNDQDYPALLVGGNNLNAGPNVSSLDVYGGAIVMNEDLMAYNADLPNGFKPGTGSRYETLDEAQIADWFDAQYTHVKKTSEIFAQANDTAISLSELSSGAYLSHGPEYFKNQKLTYHNEVFENALFITVRTDTEVNFGQWWPVYAIINIDMNWALDYELLVFNFPDAVNVTMNSSAFNISNMNHWSTTVDAWVGEQGMVERLALAEKVVYNFPKAGSVEANQSLIQGTILAPNASFTGVGVGGNGHIYGHVVVKNYIAQGNFTIHPFALSHWAFDLAEDAIEGEVKTSTAALRQYLYLNGQPTSIRLGGGAFRLIDQEGRYFTEEKTFTKNEADAAVYYTADDAVTTIAEIPLGSYILQNIQPPQGFTLNEEDTGNNYTFMDYPLILARENDVYTIVRYAEPALTDITFQMVDEVSGEGLSGAVLTIVRDGDEFEDTAYGATYLSDENGYFTSYNLPVGSYHLMERTPPAGYDLLPGGGFHFIVGWDEAQEKMTVTNPDGVNLLDGAANTVKIENRAGIEENTVALIKYAVDSKNPDAPHTLPGASFALYGLDEAAGQWAEVLRNQQGEPLVIVTDALGYCLLENLEDGRYRLVEERAPEGYMVKNQYEDAAFPLGYAYEFTFTPDISHHTAYIPNTPLAADVTVQSVGAYLGEAFPLAGVSYKLEHLLEDGRTWEEIFYGGATDREGLLMLSQLQKGRYRLTQLSVPTGFLSLAPSSIFFDLAFDHENQPLLSAAYNDMPINEQTTPVSLRQNTITIESQAKTRALSLYKIDNDYSPTTDEAGTPTYDVTYLAGAVFRLQRRTNARMAWADYGPAFTSEFQYDEHGNPVFDIYGNHTSAAVFEHGLITGDYQIVETASPPGYYTNSSVGVTLNDGVQGYQVHLFTITPDMVGTGQESRFIIEDYKKPVDLTIRLAELLNPGQGLPGGVLLLYGCQENHGHSPPGDRESCFFLSDPVRATSDDQGVIAFKNLQRGGEYVLLEEKAPQGYQLASYQWRIMVNENNGNLEILETDGTEETPLLPQEDGAYLFYHRRLYMLPATGGSGTALLYATGILLIFLSLTPILCIKEKK